MKGRKWTNKDLDLLKEIYPTTPTKEVAERLGRSVKGIGSKAKVLGLKKDKDFKYFTSWTEEEHNTFVKLYPNTSNKEIARILGKSKTAISVRANVWKLKKSEAFMSEAKNNGRFDKGHIPFTKGKKQTEYMSVEAIERTKATRFKKGNEPAGTLYDGAIRIRKHRGVPYEYIRISKGNWMLHHHYIWIKAGNTFEKGMNVVFRDGNQRNVTLKNLEYISDKELMSRNSIANYPSELQSAIRLIHKLNKTISNATEQNQ